MIRFEGELSHDVRNKYLKEFVKAIIISGILLMIIAIIPIMIILFVDINDGDIALIYSVLISCSCGAFLAAIAFCVVYPLINFKKSLPLKIEIDDDNYISYYFKDFSEMYGKECVYQSIEYVKKVKDCGCCYIIYFYYPHKMNCICQKDLLTEGTIEQFEEIFKDKLIKV